MAEDVLTVRCWTLDIAHTCIVERHFNGSMMDLRMFMKGTHCKTRGEISGEGRELGEEYGKSQCLSNCVIKQKINPSNRKKK